MQAGGPLRFDELVEFALYHPQFGFYASGGQAGRRGDFVTSPELGPLFGAVLAQALDTWWGELGCPDRFVVVEAGAGRGSLAAAVLRAEPKCASALRYLLVERSAALRSAQAEHLQTHASGVVLAPYDRGDHTRTQRGPIVTSCGPEIWTEDVGPCVVVANELLDNLGFELFERKRASWRAVAVAVRSDRPHALTEVLVPVSNAQATRLAELVPDAEPGQRVPVQACAAEWVQRARRFAGLRGRVVLFDYAVERTADLAKRPQNEWLRTYAAHERGAPVLELLGRQDITAEVCIDQLPDDPVPRDVTQRDFLRSHGLHELVEEARRVWRERAAIGDLVALEARSRISEADALTDPSGLGAFRVLEWPGL